MTRGHRLELPVEPPRYLVAFEVGEESKKRLRVAMERLKTRLWQEYYSLWVAPERDL